jgi:hypothetical protein
VRDETGDRVDAQQLASEAAAGPPQDPAAPSDGFPGHRRRWWWLLGAAALAVLIAVTVAVVWPDGAPEEAPPPPPAQGGTLTRADWDGTAVGVFRRTSSDDVAKYEDFLGRPVDLVVDYSARGTWKDIAEPEYLFEEWEGSGKRLVLGVAMLPTEQRASIEDGAAGTYDKYFRTLAQGLVDAGQQDAILRVGWEMNLDSWPWATSDEQAWVAYYQRIVTAMRDVPGERFRFDWTVNNGAGMRYDAVDYYPGDEYVDYVGVDAYDVSGVSGTYPFPDGCDRSCRDERRREAWDVQIYGGDRGLRFWSGFAEQHDKLLSLPEWGVWDRDDHLGGGDNPYYIEQMAAFIADPQNRVAYQAYFENSNEQGTHRLMTDRFPRSKQKFLDLFGG